MPCQGRLQRCEGPEWERALEAYDQAQALAEIDAPFAGTVGELIYGRTEDTVRVTTEFFKDGDNLAIRTNASTFEEFVGSIAKGLAAMIEERRFEHDWEFQLERWIENAIDIACKLRGYKADVVEERVITAGFIPPENHTRVSVINPVAAPTETATVGVE